MLPYNILLADEYLQILFLGQDSIFPYPRLGELYNVEILESEKWLDPKYNDPKLRKNNFKCDLGSQFLIYFTMEPIIVRLLIENDLPRCQLDKLYLRQGDLLLD